MTVAQKIDKVRKCMKNDNVSIYIVTSSDYHNSEYTGDFFQTRKFLSGFTGSAGTLIVGVDEAVLYTDGRYFIQAENELAGSGIRLMKMGLETTPSIGEYVKTHLVCDTHIAVDTRTISAKDGTEYAKIALECAKTDVIHRDYVGEIWTGRPHMSTEPAFELDIKYAGESRKDKLERVRDYMEQVGATGHILTTLDDIAWLLNIRGNDIDYNPLVLSYFYMDKCNAYLFVDVNKFSTELVNSLGKDMVRVLHYELFEEFVSKLGNGKSLLYDFGRISYAVYSAIDSECVRIEKENPEILMKAVKNPIECENERKAHIMDGVAVTKFIYWLKHNVGKSRITEVDAADFLEEKRKEHKSYIEPSFSTISAYNANAAMMHYNPYGSDETILEPNGVLLVDSGGQYYEGTTDITRTISLGMVSDEIKTHYTAVLRGMLNLSDAHFLRGCIGLNLDILARGPLWEMGLDYRCGTGHGVGYLSGVHEAPNGFRWKKVPERDDGCVLVPGMITTNEPGVYIEGSHGIRIENELLTVADKANEYGEFLKFETLTVVPIDMDLVVLEQMSEREKELLNKYQKMVYDTICSYLNEDEQSWLFEVCCAI